MMNRFFESVFLFPFGRQKFQWLFEQLRKIALIGLNVGRGGRVSDSGEDFVLKYVKNRICSDLVVIFDVGANRGEWGQQVLKHFDSKKIELFAFEPSKAAFDQLTKRFLDFPNFHLYHFGLSNQDGQTTLFSNHPASGIASLYRRRLDHFGLDSALKLEEKVTIQTLDHFCIRNQIKKIDFLKLDVEGHELTVLEGAAHLLKSKAIQFIQFEFGGCNIDSRTYFQDFFYLLKDQYDLFRVLKNGLYAISEYRELDECFVTTNYLAQLKS